MRIEACLMCLCSLNFVDKEAHLHQGILKQDLQLHKTWQSAN